MKSTFEARSQISLIDGENIKKWWSTIQNLYFPLHDASRNRRTDEFDDLRKLPGEQINIIANTIQKYARILQKH